MTDQRITILRDMPVSTAINKLSLPAITGFMVMGLYNVADTMFVSRWNYQGAAAIQVIFPVMMIATAIGLAFGIGGSSYMSRLLGEKKQDRACQVLSTSLFTAISIAVVYAAVSLFILKPMVVLFGAADAIVMLSVEYGFYIVIGSLFVIPSMVFNNALRAEGSAKFSMIGMVCGTALNIILDPIFIFTFHLGLKGAALATLISQGVSCFILLHFYLRKKTVLHFSVHDFRFDRTIYKEIFTIGLPTFLRQVLTSISMGVLNQTAMQVGGEYLLSGMSMAMKVTALPTFFIFGMGQGLQPVVGYNFGAKNIRRMLAAQRYGMQITFLGALASAIVLVLFSRPIALIFTAQKTVRYFSVICLRVMAAGIIFTSISNTIAVIYQGMGNGKAALLFSVLRQGILLIPAIVILSRFYSSLGVILAQPVADFITLIISVVVYKRTYKSQCEGL